MLAPEVQNWSEEQGLTGTGSNKFMKDFNPKSNERVRRKKKKVKYYNETSARTKCGQVEYHEGMYLKTQFIYILCVKMPERQQRQGSS